MAKPFYRSGESFADVRDILSCTCDVDYSTSIDDICQHSHISFHFDFDIPKRQVISCLSDYRFGYASMHTYPSIVGLSPVASEDLSAMRRIQLDEYLISSSHHKPIET